LSSFIDRLKQGRLWDFPGGVFPEQFKALSNQVDIADIPLPEKLCVPVKQHIGVEGKLTVTAGDMVLKGQPLTQSSNPFAVPVHAPTSGEVVAITDHVSAHPSGFTEPTVVIKPDGLETWVDLSPLQDYKSQPKPKVVEALCQAGIAGMGGAGFPTHIKLSSDKQIETLIINGIECEPYITSDDRLMREHAWQIRQGIDVLCHLLNPQNVIIAIEDNKPEAIKAMEVACHDDNKYLVCHVPTKYPAGGEKQLIQVLTGKEVPQNGLPVDLGILMHNVGTCFAIADAIFAGKPLIQRVVTLTGKALDAPANVWALLGTPVSHLLNVADYQSKKQKQQRVIMGGPMMGFTVTSSDVPVVKITNCLLVPTDKELPLPQDEMPCIRCGACADACPARLLPQQLYWHSKAGELEQAQAFNIADCIECGACAFVCPSSIPLVHYYRQTKADIKIADEQKRKAEQAKERFNARQERLERERLEREAKRAGGATSRRNSPRKPTSTQAELAQTPSEQAKSTHEQQASPSQSSQVEKSNSSSKVAAAIARAKAKKAQQAQAEEDQAQIEDTALVENKEESKEQSQEDTNSTSASNSNKDRVAAAIARAKAKKAQQAQTEQDKAQIEDKEESKEDTNPASASNSNKDRVAAAIARAKAKKAQQAQVQEVQVQEVQDKETQEERVNKEPAQKEAQEEPSSAGANDKKAATDDKKARVAAAVARAKAKKQQKQAEASQAEVSKAETNNSTDTHTESVEAAESSSVVTDSSASETPIKTETSQTATQPAAELSPEEAEKAKQARIAEAIARAKARKKQKSTKTHAAEATTNTKIAQSTGDKLSDDAEAERTKRVEAAIAKAKARQQERRQSGKSGAKQTNSTDSKTNSTGEQ